VHHDWIRKVKNKAIKLLFSGLTTHQDMWDVNFLISSTVSLLDDEDWQTRLLKTDIIKDLFIKLS